jgi:hypothetical protein
MARYFTNTTSRARDDSANATRDGDVRGTTPTDAPDADETVRLGGNGNGASTGRHAVATLTRPETAAPVRATAPAPAEKPTATPPVTPVQTGRPRTSLMSIIGLVLGLSGTYAALTGMLAVTGIALGGLGLLASIFGGLASARAHITGRTLTILGLITGAGGVVFGILALSGTLSWLDLHHDGIPALAHWINTHWNSLWADSRP